MYGYPSRMYWILAALFLLLMLFVPRLRPIAAVGVAILVGLLVWGVIQRVDETDTQPAPQRGRPTTPAAIVHAVPIDQIELKDMRLTGGGAPFRLSGRVANKSSDMQIKSVMLDISRSDCHAEVLDPSGCDVLWRGRHWVAVTVPPQQEREFAISIWARGEAPRGVGTLRDEFSIVAANGEPASANGVERGP